MQRLDDRELARLPIFPLPRMTLFPKAVVPLHVFEPRYRELVVHCLERGRAVALPMLRPGYEADYEGRPPVYEVMGAGRIISEEQQADGRWNILVQGTDRVRLTFEWPADASFRVICAERLPTVAAELPSVADSARTLRMLLARLAEAWPEKSEALHRLDRLVPAPEALVDMVGAHVIADGDTRQRFLEELDLARRARLVTEAVGLLLLGRTPPGEPN
jgi:Lon protease-like protein